MLDHQPSPHTAHSSITHINKSNRLYSQFLRPKLLPSRQNTEYKFILERIIDIGSRFTSRNIDYCTDSVVHLQDNWQYLELVLSLSVSEPNAYHIEINPMVVIASGKPLTHIAIDAHDICKGNGSH